MFNLTSSYFVQVVLSTFVLIWSFWLTVQNLGNNFFGNSFLIIYLLAHLPTHPPTYLLVS
jgi:hypothetical protein